MRRSCLWSIVITLNLLTTSLAASSDRLAVFVSIAPQKYVVHQIGGSHVDIQVMVQPGANPAVYEPKPNQMVAISKARLYFSIGVGFEDAWLSRLRSANPQLKIVSTDAGIQKRAMPGHAGHPRSGRGPDPNGFDPHIWLSPPLVKIQSAVIAKALQETDPSHRHVYAANHRSFVEGVDRLDRQIENVLADRKGRQFLVFHPAWGYFADRYGLKQIPVEIEGKHPKPTQLKELIQYARAHQFDTIFVQPQFSSKSAEQIAREIGARVAQADPLASNWPENLLKVAAQIAAAAR